VKPRVWSQPPNGNVSRGPPPLKLGEAQETRPPPPCSNLLGPHTGIGPKWVLTFPRVLGSIPPPCFSPAHPTSRKPPLCRNTALSPPPPLPCPLAPSESPVPTCGSGNHSSYPPSEATHAAYPQFPRWGPATASRPAGGPALAPPPSAYLLFPPRAPNTSKIPPGRDGFAPGPPRFRQALCPPEYLGRPPPPPLWLGFCLPVLLALFSPPPPVPRNGNWPERPLRPRFWRPTPPCDSPAPSAPALPFFPMWSENTLPPAGHPG